MTNETTETMSETSEQDGTGISRETAEVLIEEWRIAAGDERGDRKARVAYREAADELEHNLEGEVDVDV